MKPSQMQSINDEVKRHEYTQFRHSDDVKIIGLSRYVAKPVVLSEDAGYKNVRAEIRARYAQGSDIQRAAELAARMCHGVEFIVANCGVSKDEAMLLVLGRTTARNTPQPMPAKQKRDGLKSRRDAIDEAKGLLSAAEAVIMGIDP
jgi:hypothetical protein